MKDKKTLKLLYITHAYAHTHIQHTYTHIVRLGEDEESSSQSK